MQCTRVLRHLAPIAPIPYIRLPPKARVHPFGTAKLEDKNALLKFPAEGWLVNEGGEEGWAIVGDAEGRRLAVEVSQSELLSNSG